MRFGEGGEAFPIYILSFPFLFSLFPRARARGKREKRKGKDKIYMGKASPPSPNLKLIKIQS